MSNYTITTNFGAKDSLPSGNAGKVIKGSEFTTEFTNIKTAVATKADTAGDTFTGVVNFSADVAVNTNTLFVDVSEAKVGIGTASPAHKLDVTGSAQIAGGDLILRGDSTDADTQSIRFENFGADTRSAYIRADYATNSSGNATSLVFGTNPSASDGSDRMVITDTGNVGIGTASPANTLTVGALAASANDQDATVGIKCNANHRGIILQENSGAEQWEIGVGEAGGLKFYDSGSATPAVTFADETGNVGIGTTSPDEKLVVKGGTYAANQSGGMALQMGDTSGSHWQSSFKIKSDGSGNVRTTLDASTGAIGGQSQEVISINTSGNVGIGTSSPNDSLHIADAFPKILMQDTDGTNQYGEFYHSNGTTAISARNNTTNGSIQFQRYDGTTAVTSMRIDTSGILLVGKTATSFGVEGVELRGSPSSLQSVATLTRDAFNVASFNRLSTNGTIIKFNKDGTTVGSISVTSSATAYNTSSDERLKENITDSADAGSKVDAIQIRQFDWKADGSHQDYGVIAQELLEVAPEAVSEGDTEEDMMGVDYSKLVPMLIKEVQSLRSRVAELENV